MKLNFDFTGSGSFGFNIDGDLTVKDSNDNLVYLKTYNGYEEWYEYNTKNIRSHVKTSHGIEYWLDNGNEISKEKFDSINTRNSV